MPDQTQQPTILVKKADGTFVRMTLAEVKAMQTIKSAAVAQPSQPQVEIKKPIAPIRPIEPVVTKTEKILNPMRKTSDFSLQTSTIVKSPQPEDRNQKTEVQKQWTREDAKSLLEEKLGLKSTSAPLVSLGRQNQVAEVLNKLDFKPAPGNDNRLQSIIQLRLKDIRDEEQTRESLLRPVLEGGLGLEKEQSQKVIIACNSVITSPSVSEGVVIPLKKGNLGKNGIATSPPAFATAMAGKPAPRNDRIPMVEPQELPDLPAVARRADVGVYHEPPVPSVSTPFNAFKSSPSVIPTLPADRQAERPARGGERVDRVPPSALAVAQESLKNFKLNSQPVARKIIQDVTSSSVEMGPVEDMNSMSLVDFRRISHNPIEAAARLKQKLFNLRDESYLLYLEGLAAWHASPLYHDYIQMLNLSLIKRQPLRTVMADKNKMQLAELEAIVIMEEEL